MATDSYISDTNNEGVSCENSAGNTVVYRVVKRIFDVVACVIGIVVLSPTFLCVAIAVKATSPGPVIFKQKRYGINQKPFTCYKFRSMKIDTPNNIPTRIMGENKSVMTPIGATLRKWSLDELPQMVNIIKGDMSVVGPRPVIIAEYDQIEEREKYHANDIRPGLTGLAQINGRDDLSIEQKAAYDGEYRKNMGFKLDFAIFFKSFPVVIKRIGYDDKKQVEQSEAGAND